MNKYTTADKSPEASNVLVLAPFTPDGTQAFIKHVSPTTGVETQLAIVTYTQPPQQWLAGWKRYIGPLPRETYFIHASGMAHAEFTNDRTSDEVTIEVVDPMNPMEIIVSLCQRLQEWSGRERQSVASVQTLTILLEYIDFDTAFRYLHVLTNRIQTAGATGYFQMDPDIHDAATINTIKSLSDVIVEISNESVERKPLSSVFLDTETTASRDSPNSPTSTEQSDGCLLTSIPTVFSTLFDQSKLTDNQSEAELTVAPSTAPPDGDAENR